MLYIFIHECLCVCVFYRSGVDVRFVGAGQHFHQVLVAVFGRPVETSLTDTTTTTTMSTTTKSTATKFLSTLAYEQETKLVTAVG